MRNRIFAILAIFAVPSCVTTEGAAISVTYTPGGKAVVRLVPSPDASLFPLNTK